VTSPFARAAFTRPAGQVDPDKDPGLRGYYTQCTGPDCGSGKPGTGPDYGAIGTQLGGQAIQLGQLGLRALAQSDSQGLRQAQLAAQQQVGQWTLEERRNAMQTQAGNQALEQAFGALNDSGARLAAMRQAEAQLAAREGLLAQQSALRQQAIRVQDAQSQQVTAEANVTLQALQRAQLAQQIASDTERAAMTRKLLWAGGAVAGTALLVWLASSALAPTPPKGGRR
jgi:hypothetical protein